MDIFKQFVTILAACILWRYYQEARLIELLIIILRHSSWALSIWIVIGLYLKNIQTDHLRSPSKPGHFKYWLQIFNAWICLALSVYTINAHSIKMLFTESGYTQFILINTACAALLGLLFLLPRKQLQLLFNALILGLTLTLCYQLALSAKEPAPEDAVVLNSPIHSPFTVLSGGYSKLDSAMQRQARQSRRFAIYLSPSETGFRSDSYKLIDFPEPYGTPLYAPVDGRVIALENNAPDTPMGQAVSDTGPGNFIMIQSAPECFIVMAHLKQGSLRPKVGDTVRVGEPIAAIGRSGMTTEPALVLVAFNQPALFNPNTFSYPIRLQSVQKTGAPKEPSPYFPIRNDHFTPILPKP